MRMPLRPYLSLFIVAPDDGRLSYSELKEMVTEINETQVAPEDRLTFTERKRAKEQDIGKQEPVKETAAEKAVHPERIKHKSTDMEL